MSKKAKSYHPSFKFKAVLESFEKSGVSEVARKFGIRPNQLSTWRKQFLDNGSKIFNFKENNR